MSFEMNMRVFAEDGPCWQNSRTTLRMCGTNAACPLAGAERNWALQSAEAIEEGGGERGTVLTEIEYIYSALIKIGDDLVRLSIILVGHGPRNAKFSDTITERKRSSFLC